MSSESIPIEVGDGHRIVVEVFEGAITEAVVLMVPAMGVAAGYSGI